MDQECKINIYNNNIEMEQETATLILNTYDISQVYSTPTFFYNKTVDNQYGTISNNRCTLTWKNINMKKSIR